MGKKILTMSSQLILVAVLHIKLNCSQEHQLLDGAAQPMARTGSLTKVRNNFRGKVRVLSMAGEELSLKPGLKLSLEPGSGS